MANKSGLNSYPDFQPKIEPIPDDTPDKKPSAEAPGSSAVPQQDPGLGGGKGFTF